VVTEARDSVGTTPAADLLAELTHDDWADLQFAYNYGTIEPARGSVEDAAFRHFDAYARAEAERVEAAGEVDEAWAAAHAGEPEPDLEIEPF